MGLVICVVYIGYVIEDDVVVVIFDWSRRRGGNRYVQMVANLEKA